MFDAASRRIAPSFSPLRGGFSSCPAGLEQSLGLPIEGSPPTHLRVRPSRDVPRRGPSLFAWDRASDTPPRNARSVPARTGEMAREARGAHLTPNLPVHRCPAWKMEAVLLGGRVFNAPVPRVADISAARGHPACASAAGDAGPDREVLLREGNSEGPDDEAHCGAAGEEPAGAGRGGAQACRRTPRLRQNKTSRSEKRRGFVGSPTFRHRNSK